MKLKVLNWNLWNSFKEITNPFEVDYLESRNRRMQRYQLQNRLIQEINADICLFQEVNPVRERMKEWESLSYSGNYQVDQAGLKLFGYGLPMEFENALVNMSKLGLEKVKSLKLSPARGFHIKNFSLQLSELRYALFSEYNHYGKRLLLINTHLHHGIEWSRSLQEDLEEAKQSGLLSREDFDSIVEEISYSTYRKKEEIQRLAIEIKNQSTHYQNIILAGDFNLSEDSPYLDAIHQAGLHEVKVETAYTWDPEKNQANAIYSNQLPPPVKGLKNQDALQILRNYDLRKRNIDRFYVSESLRGVVANVVGDNQKELGFCASDHFALLMEVEL